MEPLECGAPRSCVETCGGPVVRIGCCPCEEGLIDQASCDVDGVVLTAVIGTLSDGTEAIIGEWSNGTDETIFLRGCDTTDGEYLDENGAWQLYGAFAQCAVETEAVEIAPGET